MSEKILTVIPGSDRDQQLIVVLCNKEHESSWLELRQQSWGDGVGWFTQSSVVVDPQQVAHLRVALGTPARQRGAHLPTVRGGSGSSHFGFEPRVVRAESA